MFSPTVRCPVCLRTYDEDKSHDCPGVVAEKSPAQGIADLGAAVREVNREVANPAPSSDDRIRAARFDRLMQRYADLLFVEFKKKSETSGISFSCAFNEAAAEDRALVLDALSGDSEAYERVHGDLTVAEEARPAPESGVPYVAGDFSEPHLQSNNPNSYNVHFEAKNEDDLVREVAKFLGRRAARPESVVAAEILGLVAAEQPTADETIAVLQAIFQKAIILHNHDSATYTAQGWYDGKGMLPPNVEVARCADPRAAALALYRAMTTAFPWEVKPDA